MLSLVPICLVMLLASPAHSQLAPAANDSSSVVVSDHADIATEPGKAQPNALESHVPGELAPSEAKALKDGAQTPLGDEEALRRELAAARAELAKQAQALKAQQQTGEALSHSLETAQRVIENLSAAASLWDSEKAAMAGPLSSIEGSQATEKQALDDERHKVELLEQELTTARQTIDALKTGANLAATEQAKATKDRQVAEAALKQAGEALELERERADSAGLDLDIVRKERDALKQNLIELDAALDQERERATGLARSLGAARETIDIIKDKRRTAAVERAPKARTPARALASTLSPSAAQPVRKPRLPEKQKVKVQKSPQTVLPATIALPAALLPTRPLNTLDLASEDQ